MRFALDSSNGAIFSDPLT